tara:strand:- start:10739 stop:11473 length:735 start_codon:yes stop_codon:yes gene_type:complete
MTESKFISYGILFFLGYVQRKLRSDPQYLPNSLIRAINAAAAAAETVTVDRNAMGTAFDVKEDDIQQGYAVIVARRSYGIEILKIQDLTNNVEIPPELCLNIFNIQILLDKYSGEEISVFDAVDVMNSCFESPQFIALGDNWPAARDKFIEAVNRKTFNFGSQEEKVFVQTMLSKITRNTNWEDYPSRLRSLISAYFVDKDNGKPNTLVISTTGKHLVKKSQIFKFSNNIVMDFGMKYMAPKFR